jgi:hypothetical protein
MDAKPMSAFWIVVDLDWKVFCSGFLYERSHTLIEIDIVLANSGDKHRGWRRLTHAKVFKW